MQSFREYYRKKLNEAGKDAQKISWNKMNDELQGSFEINEVAFDIEVSKLELDKISAYQFKFYREGKTKMFNDIKYSYKVIPTIKSALDYAMKTLDPDILLFAASDDSVTKKALYKTEASYIATKYNYLDVTRNSDLEKLGFGDDILFGVYRTEDIMKKALELSGF